MVVVAVDGALRARVPLEAAVRGPPPRVALYLADEDVPVLGEGGAGPGEGQRVARVLREVNLIILRFVCWFTVRARNEPSRNLKLHKHREGPYYTSALSLRAVVAALNQEKALIGA